MADPRVRVQTTVTQSSDVAKAGDVLQVLSVMRTSTGDLATFVSPSVAHLALDAAIRSAQIANELRTTLANTTPPRTVFNEPVVHIEDGETPGALYDTFLHAMSTAIFSYLAVENFANEVIGRHPERLQDNHSVPSSRYNGKKSERRQAKRVKRTASGAERESLSEKLCLILPRITGIEISKGRDPYQDFRKLEQLRHNVVHMKSGTSAGRVMDLAKVPKQPVWDDFIDKDSLWMPMAALQVVKHFKIDTLSLDWVSVLEDRITNTRPVENS